MKLSKREKMVFYLSIALLLAFALERLIFRPLIKKLSNINQEIQLRETKLVKSWRTQGQREQIYQEYKSYEKFTYLSGSDEEISALLLKEIEKLARDAGISLSNIKPRTIDKRTLYKEYSTELQVEASMKEIVTFMYSVGNSNLLLNVDKLVLSLKEEKSDILKANMVISCIIML